MDEITKIRDIHIMVNDLNKMLDTTLLQTNFRYKDYIQHKIDQFNSESQNYYLSLDKIFIHYKLNVNAKE